MDNEALRAQMVKEHAENIQRLARIEAEVLAMKDVADALDRKLFGNGQPGILQAMEGRITTVEKFCYRAMGFAAGVTLIVNMILLVTRR